MTNARRRTGGLRAWSLVRSRSLPWWARLSSLISVVVGVVRIVRHDARLGAKRLKRYNAFILPIAGRRTSPYALLRHTGRRSGRTYPTPLGAYRFGDGFVLGLTYGPDAEWCRNVVASGYAVLRWHGQDYALERPEVIPMNPRVLRAFPLPLRPLLARELTQYLWLHQPIQAPEYAPPDDRTDFATTTAE